MTNSAANHIELSGVAVRTAVHAEGACKNVLAAIKKLGHLQISNIWISYCLAYLAFGMGLQTGVWNSSLDCRQLHTVFIQWFQRKLVSLLGRLRFSIVSSFHRWSRETQQRDTCAQCMKALPVASTAVGWSRGAAFGMRRRVPVVVLWRTCCESNSGGKTNLIDLINFDVISSLENVIPNAYPSRCSFIICVCVCVLEFMSFHLWMLHQLSNELFCQSWD